jgi:exodeoxyribonuclease V alpha subunit
LQTVDEALRKLQASAFRAKFRLSEKDRAYIREKGMDTIRDHARDFVRLRLAPAQIPNDGKQTPMRGHPVFLAQHACACCCRGCLYKWYRIPPGRELTERQQEKIVKLLMAWIERQMGDRCVLS